MSLLSCSLAVLLSVQPLSVNAVQASQNPIDTPHLEVIESDRTIYAEDDEEVDTLVIYQGEENFKISDYIKITCEKDDSRLVVYGAYDTNTLGTYPVKLFAVDKDGETVCRDINIEVIEKPKKVNYTSKEVLKSLHENGTVTGGDAYSLALDFVGMSGDCATVANAFLRAYFGNDANISDVYEVDATEAKPGDILFYDNGGLGIQHYGIYLGGENALQGNFEGTAKIKGVYLKNASEPHFLRYNG